MKLQFKKFAASTGALLFVSFSYFAAPTLTAHFQGSDGSIRLPLLIGPRYNRVPIFLFHNIDGDGKYSLSRRELRDYLQMIKESQTDVIPLSELLEAARENRRFDHPVCVVTIDDDFKNIVRVGAPLLREFSFPATLFVYIKDINTHPRGGMSWEDLERLTHEGFEIQNHSWTHSAFHHPYSYETGEQYSKRVEKEILLSKRRLETGLPGQKIYAFAYPMGYHSEPLREKLEKAKYEILLTTDGKMVDLSQPFTGTFDRYTIQRLEHGSFKKKFQMILERAKVPEAVPVETQEGIEVPSEAPEEPFTPPLPF